MKSWLLQALFDIRHSYWFVPSLMALGAIALAMGMVSLDVYYLKEIPVGYEWLFRSQPSGARAILSTVAGSTITVAGVVFSMTIMAVSHATSNYGSRLLLKFLSDRRNQFALGTFIATFIYCLLVLRTVSSADSAEEFLGFVPHLAVLGALGMALASVGVLIGFIHHVPDTIHIGGVASDRGKELIERLDMMFLAPDDASNTGDDTSKDLELTQSLISAKSGYLQTLDLEGLVQFCADNDLIVKLTKPLGDFTYENEVLIQFDTGFNAKPDGREADKFKKILNYFVIGSERTPAQDTRFLIEELSQIAIRALSSGVNDPFTAITCIDWLGNAVAHSVDREPRAGQIKDAEGRVRVIMPQFRFDDLCEHIFTQLKPYIVKNITTSMHMGKIFENILISTQNSRHKELITRHARVYLAESQSVSVSDEDHSRLRRQFSSVS